MYFSSFMITAAFAVITPSVLAYNGQMTFYSAGLGACGKYNSNSEFVVALAAPLFDSVKPCGRTVCVRCPKTGRTVQATVVDRCEGCAYGDVDGTATVFQKIAALDVGRTGVEWEFCDGKAPAEPPKSTQPPKANVQEASPSTPAPPPHPTTSSSIAPSPSPTPASTSIEVASSTVAPAGATHGPIPGALPQLFASRKKCRKHKASKSDSTPEVDKTSSSLPVVY